MKYFSYDTEDGFQLHATADEARKSAEDALRLERYEAYDGWADEVEEICWGEVRQVIVETLNRPRTEEDIFFPDDCKMIVDYGLVDCNNILLQTQNKE